MRVALIHLLRPQCYSTLSTLIMFIFFNEPATTEIYPLSLHDALPISPTAPAPRGAPRRSCALVAVQRAQLRELTLEQRAEAGEIAAELRSEEHTSELQSLAYLVCRLLLEKKKKVSRNQDTDARRTHTST